MLDRIVAIAIPYPRPTTGRRQMLVALLLAIALSLGGFQFSAEAAPLPNPDLGASCGLDVVLVLDASGSIGWSEIDQVRNASAAFISALEGTGSRVAIVEFAGNQYQTGTQVDAADVPVPYTAATADNISALFTPYLYDPSGRSTYHDGRVGTYTNWTAAF